MTEYELADLMGAVSGDSLVFLFARNVRIDVAYSYQKELLAINPARHPMVHPWFQLPVYITGPGTLSAWLKFMWDIRHPSAE